MIPIYFGPRSYPEENAAVEALVSSLIWGAPGQIRNYCSMGVFDDDGTLVAGTIYHNWNPESGVIELSSASTTPRWLTRRVIAAMFGLPFDRFGARMVALRVSEHNDRMRGIARRFGFHEAVIPDLRGPGEDECIYTLSSDGWNNHKAKR